MVWSETVNSSAKSSNPCADGIAHPFGMVGGLEFWMGTGKDWIVREEHGGNANVPADHTATLESERGSGGDEDVAEDLPEEGVDAGITVDDDDPLDDGKERLSRAVWLSSCKLRGIGDPVANAIQKKVEVVVVIERRIALYGYDNTIPHRPTQELDQSNTATKP